MKRTPALIAGLVLAVLAGSASAQWRTNGGRPRSDYPGAREQHVEPVFRGAQPPLAQPTRGPPNPVFPNHSLGAGWGEQQDAVRAGVRERRYVPLGQAIESIRRRGPGRELDAGLEAWQGRPAYRVRWEDPAGRRIDYMVDAESGAILGVDEGR